MIPDLPDVVFSTRPHTPDRRAARRGAGLRPHGRGQRRPGLARHGTARASPSRSSRSSRPRNARRTRPHCPGTTNHHDLVAKAVELIAAEEKTVGGQLGRPSGARFRTYERLSATPRRSRERCSTRSSLRRAIEDIYSFPLRQVAVDTLNRQLRQRHQRRRPGRSASSSCAKKAGCASIHEEDESQEPQIICSLGLRHPSGDAMQPCP